MSFRSVLTALLFPAGAAHASVWQGHNWQIGWSAPASPVAEWLAQFHILLLLIGAAITVLVAGLLIFIMVRFNQRAHPIPAKTQHNAPLVLVWALLLTLALAGVAIPSFQLLYYEANIPKADVTIQVVGHQWYWTYIYPKEDGIRYDSTMLQDAAAKEQGKPRLLGTDNPLVVPVNANVEVVATGADVIHSWMVPVFGVKVDAIPGRLNHTWFRATHEGTYYGQCSELCGANHAYMPIEVRVVSRAAYRAWLVEAKWKYATDDASPAPPIDGN